MHNLLGRLKKLPVVGGGENFNNIPLYTILSVTLDTLEATVDKIVAIYKNYLRNTLHSLRGENVELSCYDEKCEEFPERFPIGILDINKSDLVLTPTLLTCFKDLKLFIARLTPAVRQEFGLDLKHCVDTLWRKLSPKIQDLKEFKKVQGEGQKLYDTLQAGNFALANEWLQAQVVQLREEIRLLAEANLTTHHYALRSEDFLFHTPCLTLVLTPPSPLIATDVCLAIKLFEWLKSFAKIGLFDLNTNKNICELVEKIREQAALVHPSKPLFDLEEKQACKLFRAIDPTYIPRGHVYTITFGCGGVRMLTQEQVRLLKENTRWKLFNTSNQDVWGEEFSGRLELPEMSLNEFQGFYNFLSTPEMILDPTRPWEHFVGIITAANYFNAPAVMNEAVDAIDHVLINRSYSSLALRISDDTVMKTIHDILQAQKAILFEEIQANITLQLKWIAFRDCFLSACLNTYNPNELNERMKGITEGLIGCPEMWQKLQGFTFYQFDQNHQRFLLNHTSLKALAILTGRDLPEEDLRPLWNHLRGLRTVALNQHCAGLETLPHLEMLEVRDRHQFERLAPLLAIPPLRKLVVQCPFIPARRSVELLAQLAGSIVQSPIDAIAFSDLKVCVDWSEAHISKLRLIKSTGTLEIESNEQFPRFFLDNIKRIFPFINTCVHTNTLTGQKTTIDLRLPPALPVAVPNAPGALGVLNWAPPPPAPPQPAVPKAPGNG